MRSLSCPSPAPSIAWYTCARGRSAHGRLTRHAVARGLTSARDWPMWSSKPSSGSQSGLRSAPSRCTFSMEAPTSSPLISAVSTNSPPRVPMYRSLASAAMPREAAAAGPRLGQVRRSQGGDQQRPVARRGCAVPLRGRRRRTRSRSGGTACPVCLPVALALGTTSRVLLTWRAAARAAHPHFLVAVRERAAQFAASSRAPGAAAPSVSLACASFACVAAAAARARRPHGSTRCARSHRLPAWARPHLTLRKPCRALLRRRKEAPRRRAKSYALAAARCSSIRRCEPPGAGEACACAKGLWTDWRAHVQGAANVRCALVRAAQEAAAHEAHPAPARRVAPQRTDSLVRHAQCNSITPVPPAGAPRAATLRRGGARAYAARTALQARRWHSSSAAAAGHC